MKKQLLSLSTSLLLAACGDDSTATPDAQGDVDARPDAPAPDAPPTWTAPSAHSFMLSSAGHDRMYSVAVGQDGKFYVAGFRAQGTSDDKIVVVVRLLANGMPDTTFGQGGMFSTGVVFKGGDDEIDIAQIGDTNTFIVSATVAATATNDDDAADTDIGLIKIKSNATTGAGELDTTFGGGDGIAVHSLNTSALNTADAVFGKDQARGLAVRANGEIFIHGGARANGTISGTKGDPRQDTDFVVAKFLADGSAFDTNFAGDGKFEVDIHDGTVHMNATPRGISLDTGGAVIAGGYAGGGGTGPTEGPQPVLYRLTAAGAFDTNFAPSSTVPGLLYGQILSEQAEVYNFALHDAHIVTGGYGRNDSTTNINDWVSFRFNIATGARDTTWGGSGFTDGKVLFDPTPANADGGSNCRNAIALPNGKTLLLGSSNRDVNSMPRHQDATFAVLNANGALDTAYGTGIANYMLGDDGADAFWGGAANSTHVLIVGWRATVGTASATNNDDAYAVLLELE